jgi:hypothetical protein
VLIDGTVLPFAHDLGEPLTSDVLEGSLRAKAAGLLGAEADRLWQVVADLDAVSAADLGKRLRAESQF